MYTTSFLFKKITPNPTLVADVISALMVVAMVRFCHYWGGSELLLDMKKSPPAWHLDFFSLPYPVLLWIANIILFALYFHQKCKTR
jgi:hypothetical protein